MVKPAVKRPPTSAFVPWQMYRYDGSASPDWEGAVVVYIGNGYGVIMPEASSGSRVYKQRFRGYKRGSLYNLSVKMISDGWKPWAGKQD